MDIRRRFLSKKSSGGSSGGDSSGTYTVNLNSQWEKTTAVTNPDSSLYDGVYRSTSNYHVNSGVATMYITLTGCSTFKLYIRSYAESDYDYVMVSQLDKTITGSSSYSDTTLVKAHTRGKQQSGTTLSSYTLVEYTGISSGSHTITIVYRKDSSVNNGDDRGYVLIPKSQGSGEDSGGGDVDIDTTYSIMYTSSDGNVVTPYRANVFGANITSNTYINGQGIITFDGPVTKIGSSAFSNCTTLTSITIPDSVTEIESYAFNRCTSVQQWTIPFSVTNLATEALYGCSGELHVHTKVVENNVGSGKYFLYNFTVTRLIIGPEINRIGNNAFNDCTTLTSVTISDSVTEIGSSAFEDCSSLTNITLGNNITSIGNYAFRHCSSITSIIIPDSVTKIGSYAFSGCAGKLTVNCNILDEQNYNSGWFSEAYFTDITIGNGVSEIGAYAFYNCRQLQSISIPDSVTDIGNSAFSSTLALARVDIFNMSAWCKINFENQYSAPFQNSPKLYINNTLVTDLVIPDDITEIKNYAFWNVSSLKTVTIHDKVTSIGYNIFTQCKDLDTLTIGSGVTSIGTQLINCNTNAVDLYCRAKNPPVCSNADSIFTATDYKLKVYVPKGTLNAYKSSPAWSKAPTILEY